MAWTFDDLPGWVQPSCDLESFKTLNRKLVTAIVRNEMPATGLVVESTVCEEQQHRIDRLYGLWLSAGLELGNHTYSHRDFNRVPLDEYQDDVIGGEKTLRPLMARRGQRLRYFRYPFLRSGTELRKKRAFEDFLRRRGYVNAPVTIDNDEYIYAAAYAGALRRGDKRTAARVADDYIRYMDSVFAFYEKLSRDTLGYELPQILLLHVNQLNADHLDRLSAMARVRGYEFVSLQELRRRGE